jgi:hypothetical protein
MTMTHRKAAVALAVAATLGASGTAAFASQPNIFGGPGTAPSLNPNCSRAQMFITPAGKTWAGKGVDGKKYVFAISTVLGGQVKCLIHRVDKLNRVKPPKPDTCFAKAGPVPATNEAAADKQGYHDTQGLNALAAWAKKLQLCEAAR